MLEYTGHDGLFQLREDCPQRWFVAVAAEFPLQEILGLVGLERLDQAVVVRLTTLIRSSCDGA
jgi:hypothetical protein